MPLSALFADRIHLFNDLPFPEALKAFSAPLSEYKSPELKVDSYNVEYSESTVPVMVYRRLNSVEKLPVLIWMHGGGFREGNYLMNEGDIVSRELAARGNIVVVNVDYRLVSQQIKFPAPQNDCLAVLDWVVANHNRIGADLGSVFVGGISAGGCLAANLALVDRTSRRNVVRGQLLNCPVLHKALPQLSPELESKLEMVPPLRFTPELINEVNSFASPDADLSSADASWWPGESQIRTDLPATQIINCEYDALRSSGELYGLQLERAGVEVEVLTQAGVPHAHLNRYPNDCPEMVETLASMLSFINRIALGHT